MFHIARILAMNDIGFANKFNTRLSFLAVSLPHCDAIELNYRRKFYNMMRIKLFRIIIRRFFLPTFYLKLQLDVNSRDSIHYLFININLISYR